MKKLTKKDVEYLKGKFKERINFDKTERKLYSHDIAEIPSLIKFFFPNILCEIIIQPENEEEVSQILKFANKKGIPVVPRGKATSGYGGVIPIKKSIVIDFWRMQRIIEIDEKNLTVTVEPGITWEKLDRELLKRNLTLRLYPTSYPSSTVGGWFAQGGVGIGSYEYGYFSENVISIRVVFPDGSLKEFEKDEIKNFYEAEGTTGIITRIKLYVKPYEEIGVISIACPDSYKTQDLMEKMVKENLPIWSMMFINPKMAEMKNRAPLMEHHGHPVEERVLLPAAYIITLTFSKKYEERIKESLNKIVKICEAEILSERIARHEWERRFKLMIVKRLGPSLIPAEIIVPLKNLGKVMDEIEKKVNQPVVKEGVIIKKGKNGEPEAAILGFIPADQRKFSYNFVFPLVLTIMKIAEKYNGRPYSTGLYFVKKAEKVLGKEKVKNLIEFKKKVDPKNILNPGKVFLKNRLTTLLTLAEKFEPILKNIGNIVLTQIGERPTKSIKGIPPDIVWYAYSCSQCGYCIDECDQFYGRGWESQSPRGKWYWLREYIEGREKWNQKIVDTFLVCTTCELCNLRCSAALPIEPSWMKLRGKLIYEDKKMTFPPFEMMAASLQKEGDIWAGYRKDRTKWFPGDLWEKHGPNVKSKNVYFAGCTASYVEKDIGIASVRLLDSAGVDFTYLGEKENCCGTPMLVAGKWDVFVEVMRQNIESVKEKGADTVITSCPACDMMWRYYYPLWAKKIGIEYKIKTKHYSEIIAEKIKKGEFKFPENKKEPIKVTFHDSCHIGRVSGIYEEPRELIKAIPNVDLVEMPFNRGNAHCCGSVLTLIKEPDVAAEIGKTRIEEAIEVGAKKIVALCPCCEFQFRVTSQKKNLPVEVIDLARFASSYLGYEFPDPNPEVQKQWAVFEAMINLMTPKGFAELMGTMWKELVDAMPFGMGKMMRFFGKIPFVLNIMKPLFPLLFPKLLPIMMPKVLPIMLEKIKEKIPMPDYMVEQMPEMMPKVMNALMPHMIKDVVPLVTKPLIDYLRGK